MWWRTAGWQRWVHRRLQRKAATTYRGIHLCDMREILQGNDGFIDFSVEALELISLYDPRRFRRIHRFVSYLANEELTSGGAYDDRYRICSIDLSYYKFEVDREWYLAAFAAS